MGVRSTFSLVLSSLALLLLIVCSATPWWRYFTQDDETKGGVHTKCFIDGTCQTKGDLPNTTIPFSLSLFVTEHLYPLVDNPNTQNTMRLHRESPLYKNNGPAQVIFDATLGLILASMVFYLCFIHFVFSLRLQSRARAVKPSIGETNPLLDGAQPSYSEQKRNHTKEKAKRRIAKKSLFKYWAVACGIFSLIILGSALATFSIGLPLKWAWLDGNLFGNKIFRVDADRKDIMGEIARVGLESGTLEARNHSKPIGNEVYLSSTYQQADNHHSAFQKKQVVYKLFWGPGAGWFLAIFSAIPLAIATCCVAATASHPIEEEKVESMHSQLEQYGQSISKQVQKYESKTSIPIVTTFPGQEEIRSSHSNVVPESD